MWYFENQENLITGHEKHLTEWRQRILPKMVHCHLSSAITVQHECSGAFSFTTVQVNNPIILSGMKSITSYCHHRITYCYFWCTIQPSLYLFLTQLIGNVWSSHRSWLQNFMNTVNTVQINYWHKIVQKLSSCLSCLVKTSILSLLWIPIQTCASLKWKIWPLLIFFKGGFRMIHEEQTCRSLSCALLRATCTQMCASFTKIYHQWMWPRRWGGAMYRPGACNRHGCVCTWAKLQCAEGK